MSLLAFESEIWPLEFQLLEGGYFVFYRKVFRQNARFLQGFVCEAEELLKAVVGKAFAYSRVSSIGSLVIGHNGEVYSRFITRPATSSGAAAAPEEKLYYKDFLAPPLDSLELVFAAREIPLGTGARLVDFLILCLSVVILVGLWGIYRLGIGQIEFARQRSNFVSAVSHELKTPLTSIRMYAEMLRANWLVDEEKRKSYYDFIFFESERLSRLISNVLHFSKLTNTAEPLENKELDVCGLVLAIRQKVASQVESAGFALEVKCADEGELRQHKIIGDEDSLARIFINLVDNAIKFSGNAERKLIELGVALEESEKKVIFSVRDYGPGVPAEQVSRIFDLFYRGQDEMTRTTSGTGIGLALVRELANKHGAKVRIINRTPGAEFQVEFPVVGRFGEAPDTVKKN
ncbi:MAG TPA: HAMP domain-containing sensor histidine kinase [Oligoflexia bacterium]|nr:HAMP domain-containing sensor histidine kinase [Oligoflexia bacterium]